MFPWPVFSDVHPKLTFDRVPGLRSTTTGQAATAEDIRRLKRKLAELGYPVSSDNRPLDALSGEFDAATQRAYTVFRLRWHETHAARPSSFDTSAPDKPTIEAVVLAVDVILGGP